MSHSLPTLPKLRTPQRANQFWEHIERTTAREFDDAGQLIAFLMALVEKVGPEKMARFINLLLCFLSGLGLLVEGVIDDGVLGDKFKECIRLVDRLRKLPPDADEDDIAAAVVGE